MLYLAIKTPHSSVKYAKGCYCTAYSLQ